MTSILQFDESLFHIINGDMQHYLLDTILPYWRSKLLWAPLYLFLISFVLINFKKKGLYFIIFVLSVVAISDTISSQFIKKTIQRDRPCNNIYLKQDVHLLVGCGGGYSFTSSHATNHFAVAVFIILTLGRLFKQIKWPFIFWASSISLAQVYVGLHYPLDILGGAIVGSVVGILMAYLFQSFEELRFEREVIA